MNPRTSAPLALRPILACAEDSGTGAAFNDPASVAGPVDTTPAATRSPGS